MPVANLTPAFTIEELASQRDEAAKEYDALLTRGLSLDLTRGKPSPEQLDLSSRLLALPLDDDYRAADGTDGRNYGGLQGLAELRAIFADPLQVPASQLIAANNSSLALMHDCIVHALLSPVPGGGSRWVDESISFLCPVPGYDRHFAICERFGIEMIPVPMTPDGPDMEVVEALVGDDPRIKGIWCVPKHSNPTGACYSDETIERLAGMQTAADDFRVFWDNAYVVHDLVDEPVSIGNMLEACDAAGNPDRAFVFGSTSKITLAGSGVAFLGSSPANVSWFLGYNAKRTIGPDKLNQLRHVRFLRDTAGLYDHMAAHRKLLLPKFAALQRILAEQLGGTGLATWSDPRGGYFVNLEVPTGCAREVIRRAGEAGIALTPAGATHPYGNDPDDRTIRIAPTFPSQRELEDAVAGLATCVRLVGFEQLLGQATR